jgi:hypothetical protein
MPAWLLTFDAPLQLFFSLTRRESLRRAVFKDAMEFVAFEPESALRIIKVYHPRGAARLRMVWGLQCSQPP